MLRAGQPCLVHYSAFPWAIYLAYEDDAMHASAPASRGLGGTWRVTKLSALSDVMWWEAAYDLACLRYPAFRPAVPAHWEAFVSGYGSLPEAWRIALYAVLQRLCAAMGSYWEEPAPARSAWAAHVLDKLDTLLDQV